MPCDLNTMPLVIFSLTRAVVWFFMCVAAKPLTFLHCKDTTVLNVLQQNCTLFYNIKHVICYKYNNTQKHSKRSIKSTPQINK